MSLKHYSERSSLRENAKQVSEFSITYHMHHVMNTSQCSLTSVLYSGMSLKRYSERSSLRENMKQVSEFSITYHMQHVMNCTFSFDVGLAFWDVSETL